ncbi:MAG: flippase [Prevotellaceae bacterium]|jgi:O-antigen/teichoic acid export membrane protein|nr:flippase [Prevotellaceae bacterium]
MSVKQNIFYSVMLNILRQTFPIITAPYISRVLGVENVGLTSFVMSYVGYFVLFATLGVGYYGVREIAKYKDNPEQVSYLFSGIFQINLIATLVTTIVYLTTIFYIPDMRRDWIVFVLAGLTLYLSPVSIDWYFQGLEKFKMITIRSLIIKCLTFAGLFVFVRQREDVLPYILLSVSAVVLTDIWNMAYAKRQGLKILWRNVKITVHLKPMLILFISTIAISIFTALDTVMLGFLSSYEEVGFFTSPHKIIVAIMAGFSAINTALLPRLAFNNQQNNEKANLSLFQKTLDINLLLIVPIAIGLCLISTRFVPLFLGNEFYGSIVPMQILSFKVIVVMINSFLGTSILLALGYDNKFVKVLIWTALFAFIIKWIFIPKFGAVGASWTSLAAETIEVFLNLYFVYKFTKIRLNWRFIWTSILFTFPLFILYVFFNRIITNDILFIGILVVSSAVTYITLQRFVAKNYLVIQIINLITNKFKK